MNLSSCYSIDYLMKACPICSKQWGKQGSTFLNCRTCKIDLPQSACYSESYWLRKGFKENYFDSYGVYSCFYWMSIDDYNFYYDDNGESHLISKEIDIPLGIQQKTLETILNFK